MSNHTVQITVDARGLSCPMPIVRTKKAIDKIQSGEILELLATDKGSAKDVEAWAKTGGHTVLESTETNGVFIFYVKKG